MKKIFILAASALLLLAACEEWQPVITTNYKEPVLAAPCTDADMEKFGTYVSLQELAKMYTKQGEDTTIVENVWTKGQVVSTDFSGNIYRSLFIQDGTTGMEVKIGKTNLSNEYKQFQWVYINLKDLTLGMYGYKASSGASMLQLGMADESGSYETAYIDFGHLVDCHIFKGEMGETFAPKTLTAAELPSTTATQASNSDIGTLVRLEGLSYNSEVFALIYLTYNEKTNLSYNRVFLSGNTYGIDTWGLTKERMEELLLSGAWDDATIGSGSDKFGTIAKPDVDKIPFINPAFMSTVSYNGRDVPYYRNSHYGYIERNAYAVSQYFKMGGRVVQIRTSGYSRFADKKLDPDVLAGKTTINVTGILTQYQGSIQFLLLDEDSVEIN